MMSEIKSIKILLILHVILSKINHKIENQNSECMFNCEKENHKEKKYIYYNLTKTEYMKCKASGVTVKSTC